MERAGFESEYDFKNVQLQLTTIDLFGYTCLFFRPRRGGDCCIHCIGSGRIFLVLLIKFYSLDEGTDDWERLCIRRLMRGLSSLF